MKLISLFLALLTIPTATAGGQPSSVETSRAQKTEQMFSEYQRQFNNAPFVNAEELISLRQDKNVVILDVRTARERRVSMIPSAVSQDEFERDQTRYKNNKLIVYCTIGYRSGLYTEKLRKRGFNAFNLKGGVLAWADAHQLFVDPAGKQTRTVHTYGKKWNLLPKEYEGIW